MSDFKLNDIVDVVDKRDGIVVERAVTITRLYSETFPGRSEPMLIAELSCGYAAPASCLRPHSTELTGVEKVAIALGSAEGWKRQGWST